MLSPGLHYLRLGQAPPLVIALGNCQAREPGRLHARLIGLSTAAPLTGHYRRPSHAGYQERGSERGRPEALIFGLAVGEHGLEGWGAQRFFLIELTDEGRTRSWKAVPPWLTT